MKIPVILLACTLCLGATSQTFTTYTEADGLLGDNVHTVDVDANDNPWFGTQDGIAHFDGSIWSSYTDADGLVDNTVFAIMIDSDGNLWAGTDFGISMYDWNTWTTYTTDDGLEDNRIKHIYEDDEGLIWFGHNDGVSSFDGASFSNYTMDDGLPFGGVNHVHKAADGTMLFGTGLGGLHLLSDGSFSSLEEEDDLLSNSVRSVTVDANDNRWVATNIGISVFDESNNHLVDHDDIFTLPAPHEINPVEDVKIDSEGRVWAALYVDYLVTVGGISLYSGGVWTDYDEDDGLAGPNVRQLAITSDDDVWVATSTGVTRIGDVPIGVTEPQQFAHSIFPNPASDQTVIRADIEDGHVLTILDLQGKAVATAAFQSGQVELDVSELSSGMYLVQAGQLSSKLMVR